MATSMISRPTNIITINVGANSSGMVYLPTQSKEALLFVFRGSISAGGIYASDQWGIICPIVPLQNITMTKQADDNRITVSNTNNVTVTVLVIIK